MTPQEHIQNLEKAVAALKKAQTEHDKAAAVAADKLQALNQAKENFKEVSAGRNTKAQPTPTAPKQTKQKEPKAA